MLGGVDMSRAEQHGEDSHRQRDEQRHVAEWRHDGRAAGGGLRQHHAEEPDTALSCNAM